MENRVSYNTFYNSWHEAMNELTDEQYGRLSRAINDYCFFGTAPELTGIEKMLFIAFKPNLDVSVKAKIEGQKGGLNGGAPIGNKNASKITPPPFVLETNPPLNSETTENKPPFVLETNPPLIEKQSNGDGDGDGDGKEKEKEKEKQTDCFFSGDKPIEKQEDAITVFQKVREYWNERGIKPECRDLIIRPVYISDILRTFQHFSLKEIINSIGNYAWHKTKAGSDYLDPPPYGSLYGFLNTGVDRYFDDESFDQQFKKEAKN